jgi:redox-regulated HSP33 family molecular chaperone
MSSGISVPLAIAAVYVDNPQLKIGLGITAFVCFVFASFRIWKAEREARITAEEIINNRETRKKIRVTLGEFLAGGGSLMARCMKEDIPPPIDEGNQWNDNAEGYLANTLDASYVERFHSATGLMITSMPPSSAIHKQVWQALFIRVYRLQEFIKELSRD